MKTKHRPNTRGALLAAALLTALTMAIPTQSNAAGLLIADGGLGGVLEIKEHDVQVTLNNGVAVTQVTQVFHNTEKRQVEALYTFPVPKAASVANFSMWINGQEMIGEVLEKQRAREIYNSYKQVRRDPGLLEQTDFRTFEMRVFPIGPDADQKVQITYYQELDYDDDVATYVYPLATVTRKDVDSRTTGRFAIAVDVKSAVPIVDLDSPSHGQAFAVAKHSDTYWQANLENNGGSLAQDVVMAIQIERPKTGMDLVTSRRDGEDGFFCLTLTAGQDVALKQEGMDYVFLLDASGSMADSGKLLLSKDAVAAFLNELGAEDRFEVMTFNVTPHLCFSQLQAGTDTDKQHALMFLSREEARGGTFLQPAMVTAYKYATDDRPLNVVILSDGLTEQRERTVLLQQIQQRPGNTRVFCIGVGNDVNRPLLEQLAEDSGGLSAFISAGDNFGRQARAFRRKLMRPFATNLEIKFDGVEVAEVEPAVLPNLYHGAPVRLYGRYRSNGTAEVSLRGSVNGLELKQTAQLEFPEKDPANPEINRMWAWHRVHRLLKDADRAGDRSPVVPEIVRLGEDFSIVTEYTSFLVLENDAEYRRWKITRRNLETSRLDRGAQARLREEFDAIRNKALADLGPQAIESGQPRQLAAASDPNGQATPVRSSRSGSNPGQSRDIEIPGTGPIGPLGVLVSFWLLRLKRKSA